MKLGDCLICWSLNSRQFQSKKHCYCSCPYHSQSAKALASHPIPVAIEIGVALPQ